MNTSTPGPNADLIEYAAGIIVRSRKQPHTAPGHWAGALWEEGMLVPPGTAHRLVASEAFVVPLDDNALHVQIAREMHAVNDLQPEGERCDCNGYHYSDVATAKRVLRALMAVWS